MDCRTLPPASQESAGQPSIVKTGLQEPRPQAQEPAGQFRLVKTGLQDTPRVGFYNYKSKLGGVAGGGTCVSRAGELPSVVRKASLQTGWNPVGPRRDARTLGMRGARAPKRKLAQGAPPY